MSTPLAHRIARRYAEARAHDTRMAEIHETQKCATCRNYAWMREMNPVHVAGEYHHPACTAKLGG